MNKVRLFPIIGVLSIILFLSACLSGRETSNQPQPEPLQVGAIPDQDPEKLQRLYGKLANYLAQELEIPVEYQPVTDYAAAVTAFRVGDLDLVWFGGLTGVQARLQVPGSQAIAQREIDAKFHSVFIAQKSIDIKAIKSLDELTQLQGYTFTFGSESSTSGRLMPQYYLQNAGIELKDFKGEVGFSGSHDTTIKLVEAGTYDIGVVNEQVWQSRKASGDIDLTKVDVIWRTPPYYDYHWLINASVETEYGKGFVNKVKEAFLNLDQNIPEQKRDSRIIWFGKIYRNDQ